jgi:hypothetical protein
VTNQSVLDNDTVLQPSEKVVKLYDETDPDRRFQALESQISELRTHLLLNDSVSVHRNKNEADSNGPDAIRTHDLRRVKTEA